MKTPDLRKLSHAVALADAGSYARACERLHLSQSALTRSIQSLERELDITLFDRSKRGVLPTRDGQEVLVRARSLLLQASALQQQVRLLKKGEQGQLAFGVGPAMPSLFLPDLLVRINQELPSLSVDVSVEAISQLVELLRQELIEFFVADIRQLSPPDLSAFDAHVLVTLTPGFFVRRQHPLAQKASLKLSDLDRYPLLTPHHPPQPTTAEAGTERDVLNRDLLSRDPLSRDPLSRVYCNDLATLRKMVLETDSVLVGLTPMMKRELQQDTVIALPLQDVRHREPSQIAWVSLNGRTPSAAARFAYEQLRSLLGNTTR